MQNGFAGRVEQVLLRTLIGEMAEPFLHPGQGSLIWVTTLDPEHSFRGNDVKLAGFDVDITAVKNPLGILLCNDLIGPRNVVSCSMQGITAAFAAGGGGVGRFSAKGDLQHG